MNWRKFMDCLGDDEFTAMVEALEQVKRTRGEGLTDEERGMRFIQCVKSVRDRLNVNLLTAKLFVEKHGKKSELYTPYVVDE